MRGNDKVEAMLKGLPHGTKKVALPAISEYIVGNDAHGLKHYPPKRGQKYERTFTLQRGWRIEGGTYRERIVNSVEYAPYVPNRWAHYGWRQWADVVKSNIDGAIRSANAKVKEYLRSLG